MVTTRTGERDPVTCQFITPMIIILIDIIVLLCPGNSNGSTHGEWTTVRSLTRGALPTTGTRRAGQP